MIKKRPQWRWLIVPLLGAVIHAVILSWGSLGQETGANGKALALLAQFCGFVVIAAWMVELIGRNPNRVKQTTIGFILAILTVSLVGSLILGPKIKSLNFMTLLSWNALQALPLWAFAVVRRRLSPLNVAGLDILVPGFVLLMSPFILEGFFMDPDSGRKCLEWTLSASAWPRACHEHLQLDIFKAELIYREFQIGERIYQFPESAASGQSQAILAALILICGFVASLFRRLFGRLWTPDDSFAVIEA
ncbi:MAG: hypothetical protein ACI97A_001812 [Planctomycetota bacterium]|jgi:hypothetical protein